ncbi:hypothetical protein NKR23_g5530 [Pleurostoma richardsiae]|uniref:Methyltransferase type 12 domain-containing protein n=1 Tax=Pleurostoma richardsiae TaxID=41990 RepID=A0AA38RFY6_9PEZI|nr:hypothetical protein NKR23_g5530 [Pleurostoma richardsiae]
MASNDDAWAKLAQTWKQEQRSMQQASIDSARELVAEVNKVAPLNKAESIHDIGCGNGTVTSELLKQFGSRMPKSTELLASDISPSMIAELKERQKQSVQDGENDWARLSIKAFDAGDMREIGDNTFTHVLAGNVLYAVPDYRRVLSEVRRTLKPGGVFGYSVNAVAPWVSLMGFIVHVRPDKVAPYPPPIWHTAESCIGLLKEAGFSDVQGKTVDIYMHYDSYEGVVDFLVGVLPFMPRLMSDMTHEEVARSKEVMVEHLKKESPSLPGKMRGEAAIVTGKK